jgi:hypothetical protein
MDIGQRAVEKIHAQLFIDEQWTLRTPRAFTWLGHRLAQTVSASPVSDSNGIEVSLVSAETLIVKEVSAPPEAVHAVLGACNVLAVGSAYVFDESARSISLKLAYPIHEQILEDRSSELGSYTILQLCEAEDTCEAIAHRVSGQPAWAAHPTQGPRVSRDGMLAAVNDLFGPTGRQPSPYSNPDEMRAVNELCRDTPHASLEAHADGVCVEVAFGEELTTLIELRADVGHPWLGTGLAIRTTIPVTLPDAQLAVVAARLQTLQFETVDGGGQLGAWSVGRHREAPYITWTRFLPSLNFRRGAAQQAAMSEIVRALWADRLLCPGLPPRSAWSVLQARVEAARSSKF